MLYAFTGPSCSGVTIHIAEFTDSVNAVVEHLAWIDSEKALCSWKEPRVDNSIQKSFAATLIINEVS